MTSVGARRKWRLVCLGGAAAALLLALSPFLDHLADRNLSSHMLQHLLLLYVAPPLLVLGRPATSLRRGLPRRWRGPAPRLR
ncbi:MAG: cytochrome c oxidase assembly protein, partial [Acidimicrobiales bacterium]